MEQVQRMAQNPSFPWMPSQGFAEPEDRNESPHRTRLRAVFSAFHESGAGSNLAADILLHELAEEVLTIPNVSGSAIALRVSGGHFVCRAVAGEPTPAIGAPIEAQDGLSAECIRTGRMQVCLDTEADLRVNAETCRTWGVQSLMAVPLFLEQRLIGILEAFARAPEAFDRASAERLTQLGNYVVEIVSFAEKPVLVHSPAPARQAQPVRQRVDTWTETHLPEPEPAMVSAGPVEPVTATANAPIAVPPLHGTPTLTFAQVEAPVRRFHPRRNLGLALLALAVGVVAVAGLWILPLNIDRTAAKSQIAAQIPAAIGSVASGSNSNSIPQTPPRPAKPSPSSKLTSAPVAKNAGLSPRSGGLVVYDKGKVVYRVLPGSGSMIGSGETGSAGAVPMGGSALEASARDRAEAEGPVLGQVTTAAETEKLRAAADVASITGGKLIRQVDPILPPELPGFHLPEEVLLEGIVDRDGGVRDLRFLRGDTRLSAAAMEAVRQWRYEPFRANGQPVDMLSTISVRFR